MGKYQVRLVHPVALATGEVFAFTRQIDLPFVPFPGLELKADWTDLYALQLERVIWDDRAEQFEAHLAVTEWDGPTAEEILQAETRTGWSLDEEATAELREGSMAGEPSGEEAGEEEPASHVTLDRHR